MEKLDQAIVAYSDIMKTSMMVMMEESLIALTFYVLWLVLLMRILKPFRADRNGMPKDNSTFVILTAALLALVGTVMTMVIYLDIKLAAFGTLNFSYLRWVF